MDSPNESVHQFAGDTPDKRQCDTAYQQGLYSIQHFCVFLHFSNNGRVTNKKRSKLWLTTDTEKCFWFLEQHLFKILCSLWTSCFEQSLVLQMENRFQTKQTFGMTIYKLCDKPGSTFGTEGQDTNDCRYDNMLQYGAWQKRYDKDISSTWANSSPLLTYLMIWLNR